MEKNLSRKLPAWGGSLLFHFFVLLLLFFFFQFQPIRGTAPGERNAIGTVVFKQATDTGTSYVDSQGNVSGEAAPTAAPSLDDLLSQDFSEANLSASLPNPAVGLSRPTGATPSVARSNSGNLSGAGGFGRDLGGKVKVSLFETEGTGSKFVFVIDYSASMTEKGGRPFRAAKNHLLASLEPLTDFQQFNIIFFNDKHVVWREGRQLPWANEQNKESAKTFVQGRVAHGGTEICSPLLAAIRLNPDVIFFLSDGEETDAPTGNQFADIRRNNRGIQINTIQFGVGAARTDRSFLRTIAVQNGGQYQYINVLDLLE